MPFNDAVAAIALVHEVDQVVALVDRDVYVREGLEPLLRQTWGRSTDQPMGRLILIAWPGPYRTTISTPPPPAALFNQGLLPGTVGAVRLNSGNGTTAERHPDASLHRQTAADPLK